MDDKTTYQKKEMSSTYNPLENGKWRGSIETCIEDLKGDIEHINKNLEKIYNIVNRIDKEVEVLKFKSGVWGFMAGLIPAVVALIYWVISKK